MNYLAVLLNFQVFGDFSVIFLLLISSLIPLWMENIVCMIYRSLNFVGIAFLAQDMTLDKSVYAVVLGEMFY